MTASHLSVCSDELVKNGVGTQNYVMDKKSTPPFTFLPCLPLPFVFPSPIRLAFIFSILQGWLISLIFPPIRLDLFYFLLPSLCHIFLSGFLLHIFSNLQVGLTTYFCQIFQVSFCFPLPSIDWYYYFQVGVGENCVVNCLRFLLDMLDQECHASISMLK